MLKWFKCKFIGTNCEWVDIEKKNIRIFSSEESKLPSSVEWLFIQKCTVCGQIRTNKIKY